MAFLCARRSLFESDSANQGPDKERRHLFGNVSDDDDNSSGGGVDRVVQKRRQEKQFSKISVFVQPSTFYQCFFPCRQRGSESILAVTSNNSSPHWVPIQAQNLKGGGY